MDSEGKFWFGIWSLATVLIIAGMGFGTWASYLQRQAMVQMVEKGADPMRVSCAFGIGGREESICTIIAQQGVK